MNSNQQQLSVSKKDRFIYFLMSYFLVLERDLFSISRSFVKIVLLFSEFQIAGFTILLACASEMPLFYNLLDPSLLFSKIARPYEFADQNRLIFQYSFTVPLISQLLIVAYIALSFQQSNQHKNQNIIILLARSSSWFKILNVLLTAHCVLFEHLLYIPYLELCISPLYAAMNQRVFQIEDLFVTIFSIMALIITILNRLFILLCLKESISFRLYNFKQFHVSLMDYLCFLIQTLIPFLYHATIQANTKFNIVCILYLFHAMVQTYHIMINFLYSIHVGYYSLQIKTFCMVLCCLKLFTVQEVFKSSYQIVLVVILGPLVAGIMTTIKEFQDRKLILKHDIVSVAWLLAVYQNEIANAQEKYYKFILYDFLSKHREKCLNDSCKCLDDQVPEDELVKMIRFQLVVDFSKLINQMNDQVAKAHYCVYYIDALLSINQFVKAYQQVNIILLKQQIAQQNDEQIMLSESTFLTLSAEDTINKSKKKKDGQMRLLRVQLQNMNYITWLRFLFILEKSKYFLVQGFSSGDIQQRVGLSESVSLFMKIEEQNNFLKQQVMHILNKKKDLMGSLQGNLKFRPATFSKLCQDLVKRIVSLEEYLNYLFYEFPSRKMQSILSFYQAEIVNNYMTAYKVINYNTMSDTALVKIQKNHMIDLLSQSVQYLICSLDHQGIGLQIRNKSPQLYKIFHYDIIEFQHLNQVNQLLPQGFQYIHKRLVEQFLVTGKSKFYKSKSTNLVLTQTKFLKGVDFFYDFDLSRLSELTFQVFISESQQQSAFILLNQKFNILGVTREFCSQMKLSSEVYAAVPTVLHNQEISCIIPTFFTYVHNKLISNNKQLNFSGVDIKFFESHLVHELLQQVSQRSSLKGTERFSQSFIADINITFGCDYLVLELKNVYHQAYSANNTQTEPQIEIEPTLDLPQDIDFDIQQENTVPQPNLFNDELLERILGSFKPQNVVVPCSEQPELTNRAGIFSEDLGGHDILSPGRSARGLIDKTNSFNISHTVQAQQKFFRQELNKEEQVSIKSNLEFKQPQVDLEKIYQNQELRENLKLQIINDCQTSNQYLKGQQDNQASSTLGTFSQNFQLFKKYDLIQQILDSKTFSYFFDTMLGVLLLMYAIEIIFSIVLMSNSESDISQASTQVSVLDYQASLISPLMQCIASFLSIFNYAITELDDSQIPILIELHAQSIEQSYSNLRESNLKQNDNQYINEFLSSQIVEVRQMDASDAKLRNLTLREGLFSLVEGGHQLQKLDFKNILEFDSRSSFFVYFTGNQFEFQNETSEVNDQLLEEIISNTALVQKKWIILCVRCTYLIFFCFLTSWLLYLKHIKKYSKILRIFTKTELVWIYRDFDRCKELLAMMIKDSDIVFRYRFNIEMKERFLLTEQARKNVLMQKLENQNYLKQNKKQKFLLPRWPSLACFSFIFILFFLYSFLFTTVGVDYLSTYSQNAESFKNVSSLGLQLIEIYALREMIYHKHNGSKLFDYMTQQQIEQSYKQIESSLHELSEFLLSYADPKSSYQQFADLIHTNLCRIEKIPFVNQCDQIYSGVLTIGFQASLIKIRDSFQIEMNSSDQFFYRSQIPYLEIEAGIILSHLVDQVKLGIKDSIIEGSATLQQSILGFSIFYIFINCIQILFASLYLRQFYYDRFQLIKKCLILLPQPALFVDDLFERQLRQLLSKEQLV